MISLSDAAGAVGGIALAIPPLNDLRQRIERARQKEGSKLFDSIREVTLQVYDENRASVAGWEALCLLGGAFLLAASFVLKMVDF
ncbi:MAG: hypothetical protein WDN01_04715 [Rhizomicrobium sp.]